MNAACVFFVLDGRRDRCTLSFKKRWSSCSSVMSAPSSGFEFNWSLLQTGHVRRLPEVEELLLTAIVAPLHASISESSLSSFLPAAVGVEDVLVDDMTMWAPKSFATSNKCFACSHMLHELRIALERLFNELNRFSVRPAVRGRDGDQGKPREAARRFCFAFFWASDAAGLRSCCSRWHSVADRDAIGLFRVLVANAANLLRAATGSTFFAFRVTGLKGVGLFRCSVVGAEICIWTASCVFDARGDCGFVACAMIDSGEIPVGDKVISWCLPRRPRNAAKKVTMSAGIEQRPRGSCPLRCPDSALSSAPQTIRFLLSCRCRVFTAAFKPAQTGPSSRSGSFPRGDRPERILASGTLWKRATGCAESLRMLGEPTSPTVLLILLKNQAVCGVLVGGKVDPTACSSGSQCEW